ncbi:hypothetical protein [Thiohalobacter thiocyanaticus]|uniref:hypothetical protein n=1 Tax=Thiohalobacter thiocyanaticus TaxID=585455 RepID=UPI0012FD974E|nr:hypothetical protein [Thiohalobacter thiocyanaticus]
MSCDARQAYGELSGHCSFVPIDLIIPPPVRDEHGNIPEADFQLSPTTLLPSIIRFRVFLRSLVSRGSAQQISGRLKRPPDVSPLTVAVVFRVFPPSSPSTSFGVVSSGFPCSCHSLAQARESSRAAFRATLIGDSKFSVTWRQD